MRRVVLVKKNLKISMLEIYKQKLLDGELFIIPTIPSYKTI